MQLVTNLVHTKWCKRTEKWLKPWHMGTHLRLLKESYLMNTNMTRTRWFFKNLCILVLWTLVIIIIPPSNISLSMRLWESYYWNRQAIVGSYNDKHERVTYMHRLKMLTFSMLRLLSSKALELWKFWILSCWYSLVSSHRVPTYEYPFAKLSVIFQLFSHCFVLIKLATSSLRVNCQIK